MKTGGKTHRSSGKQGFLHVTKKERSLRKDINKLDCIEVENFFTQQKICF